MNKYILVFTTTGKKEEAEKIAKALVEKRISSCVQIIGPIASTYWWKESIETACEWLLFIKSMKNMYGELEKAIKDLHTYETPEIIAVDVVEGNRDYLEWLKMNLKKTK